MHKLTFPHLFLAAAIIILIAVPASSAQAAQLLRFNSRGHDVVILQQELQTAGYKITAVDGIFGSETRKAVLEFQRDNHLKITGTVDSTTWQALKKAPPAAKSDKSSDKTSAPVITSNRAVPESSPFLPRSKVNAILATAKKYIGVPYKFGGATPKAFDCSGYLQYVFDQNGIHLPRTADEQYKLGKKTISSAQLEPGDLVFFTTYEPGASHCGIYLGNGKFIHASSSRGIRIDELSNSYWQPRYYGGKHIVE